MVLDHGSISFSELENNFQNESQGCTQQRSLAKNKSLELSNEVLCDNNGKTSLHIVASNGNSDVCSALLKTKTLYFRDRKEYFLKH